MLEDVQGFKIQRVGAVVLLLHQSPEPIALRYVQGGVVLAFFGFEVWLGVGVRIVLFLSLLAGVLVERDLVWGVFEDGEGLQCPGGYGVALLGYLCGLESFEDLFELFLGGVELGEFVLTQ